MGTLGESVDLSFRPLPFLAVGVAGEHGKDFQEKLAFEKGGGPMRGNISRDYYRGGLEVRPEFQFGPVTVGPFAAIDIDSTKTYTIARIIDDSGAGYPEDTYAFADFDENETWWGPSLGLRLDLALGPLSASANAAYSPMARSTMDGAMFQNYTSYAASTDIYPTYKWRRLGYALTSLGIFADIGGRFSLDLPGIGLSIAGFGDYSILQYLADSTDVAEAWFPTRASATSSTTIVVVPASNLLYSVDVLRTTLEVGVSFSLHFLRRAFDLPGVPGLDLSYVRTRNDSLFRNRNDATDQQKWIDDYSYEKLVVSWGL